LHQRIFGTECEYASVYHSLGPCPDKVQCADNLEEFHKKIAGSLVAGVNALGIPRAGEFLGNGGRLYVDRGGHPEYATPECRSIADLVAYEVAGDRIVRDLAANLHAADDGVQLHLYKNNADLYGHTYGGHENYLISPQGMDRIGQLLPFLVTRQIYAGAGKIMTSALNGAFGFQVSQRADFFNCTYSDRTSETRGIINIRKREITRADQSRRLHMIIGDSNMSQYAIGLKVGTLAIMLRLLEAGVLDPDFVLESPVKALKAVSRDLRGVLKTRHNGRWVEYTALDIQSICLEEAQKFFAAHPPSPEEAQWLEIWTQVMAGLQGLEVRLDEAALESDPADLKRRIDWVLKLWLLDRSRSKGADQRQLKKLDFNYHDLNPATGLYERCLTLDLVDRLIPETEITKARSVPPQDTRARLRGMVVQHAFGKNVVVEIENWERIRIRALNTDSQARHCFNQFRCEVNSLGIGLEDPFRADDSQAMENLHGFLQKWG
jgi:proteasome accessory factor A